MVQLLIDFFLHLCGALNWVAWDWVIYVTGGTDGTAPAEMKAYINRDDLDFGTVSQLPATQKWTLQENFRGDIEYPTK